MPLSAAIQFGDNNVKRYSRQYLITDCRLHFTRHYNHLNPDAAPLCERLEVTVVAPGKEDLNLHEWYIDRSTLSGRIVFDINSPLTTALDQQREVYFENAQCFALAEDYQIGDNRRRLLRLSFGAEEVSIGTSSFRQLK